MNNNLLALAINLALIFPLLIPISLTCFYINWKAIQVLRQEQKRTGPMSLKRGAKKLFVIYPSKDK